MRRVAAVLWTGGKDCTLALCRARQRDVAVGCVATFIPEGDEHAFHAHPIHELRQLARAANLPHALIPVRAPYKENYREGLRRLKSERGIDAVVTGDIDYVDGFPNWITECVEGLGIEPILPLWQLPREQLLRELIELGIVARVSWINSEHIPASWLGRTIDGQFISDIVALGKKFPIDICGENGEYHTMVRTIPSPA